MNINSNLCSLHFHNSYLMHSNSEIYVSSLQWIAFQLSMQQKKIEILFMHLFLLRGLFCLKWVVLESSTLVQLQMGLDWNMDSIEASPPTMRGWCGQSCMRIWSIVRLCVSCVSCGKLSVSSQSWMIMDMQYRHAVVAPCSHELCWSCMTAIDTVYWIPNIDACTEHPFNEVSNSNSKIQQID